MRTETPAELRTPPKGGLKLAFAEAACFALGLGALLFGLYASGLFTKGAPPALLGNDPLCALILAGLAIVAGHLVSKARYAHWVPYGSEGTLVHLGLCSAYFVAVGFFLFQIMGWLGSAASEYLESKFD